MSTEEIKNNPCKGCEQRHEACHATCKEYKDWKHEKDSEKERVRAIKSLKALSYNKNIEKRKLKKR